jgi:hypothetical protein
MKKSVLLTLWGLLFVLCAGLGFVPREGGFAGLLLTALSVAFFVPPACLLRQAKMAGDRGILKLIRNLSAVSLLLTLVLLVGNFLSVFAGEWAGEFLYCLLVLVSSPMVCSGYWALSLFLWACLLIVSRQLLKK